MSNCWEFWIDVGGTFTDCIAVTLDGTLLQFKTLSSGITKGTIDSADGSTIRDGLRKADPPGFWVGADCRLLSVSGQVLQTAKVVDFSPASRDLILDSPVQQLNAASYELDAGLLAPILAIRWLLQLPAEAKCPPVRVRFGTTRGTNALLTRTGARTALVTTKGFGDVPLIGNQDRPSLFDLNIRKPEPLFSHVFEIDERISTEGNVLKSPPEILPDELQPTNFDSVAVCFMNAYRNPVHEQFVEGLLRNRGFSEISCSSEVSPLIRFVPRCDTTVLDAYLNPVLRQYMNEVRSHLPGSEIQVMTSTGGLVDSHSFRGRDCILSGPAGGIVGFSKVAESEGCRNAIGFDMGGTSTDVARYDGRFEFETETTKAGVRILTPTLAIETVAAGGGSICGFDGTRLFVGPQSAGASPGPACYGAGGPLTVTDLNVFLGRVLSEHFPFQLNNQAIEQQLLDLRSEMAKAGAIQHDSPLQEIAEGLLQLANDNMVQAIRKVSVAKGYHPTDYALVSFGGAGGQHACSIARNLGIRTVLIHPFAGILSAYGMGQADVRVIRQSSVLQLLNETTLQHIAALKAELGANAEQEVRDQGIPQPSIQPATLSLQLRYVGTDSALTIAASDNMTFREAFEVEHERLFGYRRPSKQIEVAAMTVESIGKAGPGTTAFSAQPADNSGTVAHISNAASTEFKKVWFAGQSIKSQIFTRQSIPQNHPIDGPAIICEPTSTVFIEPGCSAVVSNRGTIKITVNSVSNAQNSAQHFVPPNTKRDVAPDPVLLEVFNNQFVSIAEQMGETLRRTSTSTNVRERLDFSCALFDSEGKLVVNAPHVPVHLGAMGETVRAIMCDHPDMQPGDVFVTNDPYRGGSHLPDVTVITPVFVCGSAATFVKNQDKDLDRSNDAKPAFFVANRAHHAEIGGIVPGSMPPFSRNLSEEGVLIRSQRLVSKGRSHETQMRRLLSSGSFPSRSVEDNLADLAAQAAANEAGMRLLKELCSKHSVKTVQNYMQHIQAAAEKKMRLCLSLLEDRSYAFQDSLDDGTTIKVDITIDGDKATVDFTGTDGVHPGNLNANLAITTSAVLYCFRCLLNQRVPLNAGVLSPVKIIVPPGLLNPQPGHSPEKSPAVVGGNVETSQRIVDVVLGALNLAAASQGTMNNLTFGDGTFGYYETICGGAGATAISNGADAVHTHMTNTRLTDPEVMEQRYPIRIRQFSIRQHSGGAGRFSGGNGIIRELEFLRPLQVSMLSLRRGKNAPYGIDGGQPGLPGSNLIDGADVGGSFSRRLDSGDILRIATPGGGGCGIPQKE
ncbi:MAG: hydantoinase B/oxoprolinase family protein [Fuerstiella sp.]